MKRITKLLLLLIATLSVISGCKDELQSNMPELRRPDNKGNVIRANITSGINSMKALGFDADYTDPNNKLKMSLNINWEHDSWNNEGNKPVLYMCVYDKTANIENGNETLSKDKYKTILVDAGNYTYKKASETGGTPKIQISVDVPILDNIDENNQMVVFYLSTTPYFDVQLNRFSFKGKKVLYPLNTGEPVDYDILFKLQISVKELKQNKGKINNKVFTPQGTMLLFDYVNTGELETTYPYHVRISSNIFTNNLLNIFELTTGLSQVSYTIFNNTNLESKGKRTLQKGEHSYIYGYYTHLVDPRILNGSTPFIKIRFYGGTSIYTEVPNYLNKMNGKVVSISNTINKKYYTDYLDYDYMVTEWGNTNNIIIYLDGRHTPDIVVQYKKVGEQNWTDIDVPMNSNIRIDNLDSSSKYHVRLAGFNEFSIAKDSRSKLLYVRQWGTSKFETMDNTFTDCENLDITADDAPDLTECTSMYRAFMNCLNLTGDNTDFSKWNTSNVTSMKETFCIGIKDGGVTRYGKFNGNIGSWDVRKVTNMESMFRNQPLFNQDLSKWRPAEVRNFGYMFAIFPNDDVKISKIGTFTSNLSEWKTPNATNMIAMFYNQPEFNSDLNGWDTSNVTNMGWVFSISTYGKTSATQTYGKFNGDISSWKVGEVTNMESMFFNQPTFNQNISSWKPAKVTSFKSMFAIDFKFGSFNQNLSGWVTPEATDMSWMFFNQRSFNSNLSGWNVEKVEKWKRMFYGSGVSDSHKPESLKGESPE